MSLRHHSLHGILRIQSDGLNEDLGKSNRPKTEGRDNHRKIGEEQFDFMPGRGTTDAIFVARQVIEKHREMQKELHLVELHLVFTDLEKAYDRVP